MKGYLDYVKRVGIGCQVFEGGIRCRIVVLAVGADFQCMKLICDCAL